jgi:hypothetical protein
VHNQHLVDQQLLDPPVDHVLDRQLGLSGLVLPQIRLVVAGEPADQPHDELYGRPARQRKRNSVAFEAEDEPVRVRAPRHKGQKRTGGI